ncbi:putative calcium/calmodulin-dependent protein kinase type II [[Candida] jaroonii]|uniref:Calcium/calmodulin-dependent protein kinase type II n=1 Tax=[Candida] jaroonii TaxID=467808 RepID=A0ACA9Y5Q6_9ASCO|nr:putative calcium/calmodulin-dependent protein kinase type II [[Candida] jaroonii]
MGLLSFKKKQEFPNLPRNYEVLEKLGEGAFSNVYKCLNHFDKKFYAIKIINKTNLNNKQLHNIENEINIMKHLNHPSILKMYDYYNSKHFCYIILEYCDGGEIFNKIIELTYFSENLSRFIFLQLLSSIKYLHEHNIVHRDIKPENLFFERIPLKPNSLKDFKSNLRKSDDSNKLDEGVFNELVGGGGIGKIKIGDFGLAKKLVNPSNFQIHKNNLKTPCGTAGYTAPEVITVNQDLDKQNYYSKSVDIWSLGCVLYTILCGFPPFYDDDQNKLTYKILNGNYSFLKPWWDEISIEAKDLISKMLVINPNERITVDEIFKHPWVNNEKFSDDYFNVNSKFENENNVEDEGIEIKVSPQPPSYDDIKDLHLKLKSPVDNTQHIEDVGDDDSIDSDDPLSDHPSPFYPTTNSYKSTKSNDSNRTFKIEDEFKAFSKGLNHVPSILSPRANAIKSVFNNPAMTDAENLSNVNLSSVNFSNSNIFNIFNIDEDETMKNLNKLSIKSSNSSSDNDEFEGNEKVKIDTRQSSIVSNDKFQLNMNDSNIILRRKSTLKRD